MMRTHVFLKQMAPPVSGAICFRGQAGGHSRNAGPTSSA